MPWKETSTMSLRKTFIEQALQEGTNISELCRTYEISRKTAYKWLARYRQAGDVGLRDLSRRPQTSPNRTSEAVEVTILKVRQEHPTWGGYKIKAYLERKGHKDVPAHSTINTILKRKHKIDPQASQKHKPFQRFEMAAPNELWQMDFKGHFPLPTGGRCHPLTVLDDHSRFLLGLKACPNETGETVQGHLTTIFRQYGLPERMLMDNGPPWGDDKSPYTVLGAWLIRLGIRISHGRIRHPQTQGKDERLNRTFKEDVLDLHLQDLIHLPGCQEHFDAWWEIYNYERPHQALGMAVPADRYQPSPRPFPEQLPPIEYDPGVSIRKVDESGKLYFRNQVFRVGRAFRYNPVALVPTEPDGDFEVYFCQQKIAKISLRVDNC